ncbi:hypothetical protein [Burkholderia territorii]|uniref:hypothetical protein n=1 Tax=Burkholderia territorii TaxID=1503055 RepID=UPI000A6FFB1F|nr:hypothetical protein [Burkholderia territorii]
MKDFDAIGTKRAPAAPWKSAAFDAGVVAANAMLATTDGPIFLMDELGFDEHANCRAMGWNSIWASDENRRRWAEVRMAP